MKAHSKRFVNHKGDAYDVNMKMEQNGDVGFFDLWRYATLTEKLLTCAGVMLSWCCSAGLVCAVVIYGELTSLFVMRHKAEETANHAVIIGLFGGGELLSEGNRSLHMDALVVDSAAFAWASISIMLVQLTAAAVAVGITNSAATNMVTRLRWRLLRSLISQEIAFFETHASMNFASALTEDVEKLRAGVGEHVVMTSYLCGTVVFCLATSLAYGWQLTLVAFAVVPVAVLVAATVAKYQTRCSEQEVTAYSAAGGGVQEALSAIRTVRAYGGEEEEIKRYMAALQPAASHALRRGAIASAGQGAAWLLTYSLNATVFAYGAALCVRDMDAEVKQYHPGVMLTILFCTFMAAQNIAMCHPHLEIFSSARGAAKSLFNLIERKSKIDALEDKGVIPETYKGDIEFDNVYFNYPSRPDVKVLRGLTLSVKAGQTVALVGGSGCGKSTVLQLLQRLYEPDSGAISVDGHRLETLHLHRHRKCVGVVGQEPVLFTGTIRENIMLGLEGVSEAEMINAAKTAHAHQFIMKLDKGYDSRLGSGGASLSGGQKQRVAIARALLRRPTVLLLDEPTSALDPLSEQQVQAALDEASVGRTTIVVSHRLSTIVDASQIVYMEQGAVLEQGTHQELLDMKGMYWKLVNEDLTAKSVPDVSSSENDYDVVFTRAPESLTQVSTPHSAIRRSLRFGSMSAAHVPAVDILTHADSVESVELTPLEEEAPSASMWELLKLNRPEWALLLGGGVAAFLVGAAMPVFALLFSKLYGMFAWSDKAEILHYSSIYAGIFGLVAAGCGVVMCLQGLWFSRAGQALTDRLRVDTFRAYLRQEQAWFDEPSNSVGALCARLTSDCANVQGATGSRLGTVLQGVSTMSLGVTLALLYSWKMTLTSLLSVPCVIGAIYLEGFMTKRSEEEERHSVERASRVATEAVLNVATVQSLGVEWSLLEEYRAALPTPRPARALLRGVVYGLCLCAPTLGYAISLAYGGYLIARDSLHYEYAILVSEALIYGAWMLAEALSFAPNFAAARRSGARVLQILNRKSKIVTEEGVVDDDWEASGALKLSNIHFTYPQRDTPTLKGLSVTIAAGTTVALVGPSGCGKSTITNLLSRTYDPSQGTIELDGRDIKKSLTLPRLRSQLGLVQQEPILFSRSIKENIAYGNLSREVTMEEIVEAAKKANVHGFVSALPLGYATPLGAGGGASLSGGQKQRVAIARALLRNPKVLILDEATSALDASSEKLVQAALEEASRGRTTVIIAHRLATVAHAHTICVLHTGKIAEMGSHDELVKKRGLYWDLLQQQAPRGTT